MHGSRVKRRQYSSSRGLLGRTNLRQLDELFERHRYDVDCRCNQRHMVCWILGRPNTVYITTDLIISQEEPYKMTVFGKSRSRMEVVAAEFMPHERQLYILIADADCNVHVLEYNPERE